MQSEQVTQKASSLEVKNKVTEKDDGSNKDQHKDQHYHFPSGQPGKEEDLRLQHTSFITSRCPGDTIHAGRKGEDVAGSFDKDNKKEEELKSLGVRIREISVSFEIRMKRISLGSFHAKTH